MRFGRIDDLSHLFLVIFRQHNVSGGPVLFQPFRFGRARDCYHSLCSNPSQRDLCQRATLLDSQFFDLLDDGFIFVKVFALELWGCIRMSAGVKQELYEQY